MALGSQPKKVALVYDEGSRQVVVGFTTHTAYAVERRESESSFKVPVRLNRKPLRSVTIPLVVTHMGGATAADYEGIPESVTFGANDTRQTFTVMATNDSAADGGESLSIGFGTLPASVSAGSPAVVALDDDDGSVRQVTVGFGMHSL